MGHGGEVKDPKGPGMPAAQSGEGFALRRDTRTGGSPRLGLLRNLTFVPIIVYRWSSSTGMAGTMQPRVIFFSCLFANKFFPVFKT